MKEGDISVNYDSHPAFLTVFKKLKGPTRYLVWNSFIVFWKTRANLSHDDQLQLHLNDSYIQTTAERRAVAIPNIYTSLCIAHPLIPSLPTAR